MRVVPSGLTLMQVTFLPLLMLRIAFEVPADVDPPCGRRTESANINDAAKLPTPLSTPEAQSGGCCDCFIMVVHELPDFRLSRFNLATASAGTVSRHIAHLDHHHLQRWYHFFW
jgi:hypothetical protein